MRIKIDAVKHQMETPDGGIVDLATDEGAEIFRANLDGDTVVVAESMPVYQTGWGRAMWGIHPDDLEAFAATAAQNPHYHAHNSRRLLGRTGEMRVEILPDGNRRLVQDLEYSTPLAREILAVGAKLRASIGASETERSQVCCSVCGGEWLEGECDHWVGDADEDGRPWQAWVTGLLHRETSTTHAPASTGTGSDARLEAEEIGLSGPWSGLPPWILSLAGAKIRKRELARHEEVETMRATARSLEGDLKQLAAEREAMAQAEALRVVRQARRERGLATPIGMTAGQYEDRLVAMYRDRRDDYDLMIGSIPPVPMHRVMSSGAEDPAPQEVPPPAGTQQYYDWRARRAKEIASATGEEVSAVVARLR